MDAQPIQCITVSYGQVQGNAKGYRYVQPALYRAMARKDGVPTWRYCRHLGTARRSDRLAQQDAKAAAESRGIPYLPGIRHGTRIVSP